MQKGMKTKLRYMLGVTCAESENVWQDVTSKKSKLKDEQICPPSPRKVIEVKDNWATPEPHWTREL